jgi:hypothetical protein
MVYLGKKSHVYFSYLVARAAGYFSPLVSSSSYSGMQPSTSSVFLSRHKVRLHHVVKVGFGNSAILCVNLTIWALYLYIFLITKTSYFTIESNNVYDKEKWLRHENLIVILSILNAGFSGGKFWVPVIL